MISTYVDVDRFLLRGVPGCPAPSLSEQLEVSASTGSPNRIFHSKGYRSEVLAEMLAECCTHPMRFGFITESSAISRRMVVRRL